jgi:siroheme synthase (precorrin-2 oxidase/ferrochelatase)
VAMGEKFIYQSRATAHRKLGIIFKMGLDFVVEFFPIFFRFKFGLLVLEEEVFRKKRGYELEQLRKSGICEIAKVESSKAIIILPANQPAYNKHIAKIARSLK